MHFRIRDIYIPDPEELLLNTYGDQVVEGKIVEISESDTPGELFALVEADELSQPVLIPVKRLVESKEPGRE